VTWTPEKAGVSAGEINNRKAGVLAWQSLLLLVLGFVAFTIESIVVPLKTKLAIPWLLDPITMIPAFVFAIRAFRLFLAGEYPRPALPPIALVLSAICLLTTVAFALITVGFPHMH
jgi:hypothetical protein